VRRQSPDSALAQSDTTDQDTSREADTPSGRERRAALIIALVVGLIVLTGGIILTHWMAGKERQTLRQEAEARAEAVLNGRLNRARTWLGGRTQNLTALARGDALEIIAAELADARTDGREANVATELIFLRISLERQIEAFGASGLSLRHIDGQPWLTVGTTGPDLALTPTDPVIRAARDAAPVITQADSNAGAADILVPVTALQEDARVVAILAGRFPIAGLVEALEVPDALAEAGETVSVVRQSAADAPGADQEQSAENEATSDAGDTLSVTRRLDDLSWALRYRRPLDAVLAEAQATVNAGYMMSAAGALAVVMLILGVSWRQGTISDRGRAAQSERFAARMAAEQRLLETIIEGITEYLFVTDGQGRVRHANTAACDLVGEARDRLIGRTLADVLDDSDTATLLLARVPEGQLSRPLPCTLAGQEHWVMVLRNPLGKGPGGEDRWVLLVQDVTELVNERIRAETIQRAVIRTLGRTVAAADPYLADQAARMERVALLIADEMGLDDDDRMTVELTAQISQIGKLFVPRDLLTKTERLTPEEREVIQKHIEHACVLLNDLDPTLPISETLVEITERMDGSGYPRGLTGDHLSLPGRILAVADVFTARTAARAYRPGAAPEDILEILKEHSDRYDTEVVDVLVRLFDEGRY